MGRRGPVQAACTAKEVREILGVLLLKSHPLQYFTASCLALSSFPTDLFVLFLVQFFFSGVYLELGFLCFVPHISHVFLSFIVMCGLFL